MKLGLFFLVALVFVGSAFVEAREHLRFHYEAKRSRDKRFIQESARWIDSQAVRVEKYWGIQSPKTIQVRFLPLSSRTHSKSCEKTDGQSQIDLLSPESVAHLSRTQLRGFDSLCLKKSYDDLQYSVVHEYSHILNQLYLGKGKHAPQWVWEGLAIYLSEQLTTPLYREAARKALSKVGEIDLCSVQFQKAQRSGDVNLIGAAVIGALERTSPRIGLQLSKAKSNKDIAITLEKNKLSCRMPQAELLSANDLPSTN